MQGPSVRTEAPGITQQGIRPLPISDMLDILRLISKVEPLDVLLEKVMTTIVETFGIKALTICVLDEKTGVFTPRVLHGFAVDQVLAIRKHTYTLERKKSDLSEEHRIGRRAYYVRAEDRVRSCSDELDYISNPLTIKNPRASPDDWHELDYIEFAMTDRLGNWIGWIEIDEPADGKVPTKDSVDRIQFLADLTAIAVENSKMYEEAVCSMTESHGYLDLIVHDIGNMVSPLQYHLDQLQKNPTMDPKNLETAKKASAVSGAMRALVDNVRKISEMKSTEFEIKEVYDLREVLVRCISAVKRDFPSKDIIVNLDCPDCESTVMADELIHDLFANLLNNAVKYNPKSVAEVDVRLIDGHSAWTVNIEDHGPGIADDRKDKVFARFAKRPDGMSGTGMGLSIVSLLVDRYNGIVSVKDRVPGAPSHGARLEVALPKVARQEIARTPTQPSMTTAGDWEQW